MRKPDAAAVLAGKMNETLERLRDRGGDAYPPALSHLVALADPQAPPVLAAKALKKKPFAARLLAACKHPDSPIALAEDADRLADSPRLIELTLSLLCTPEKRLHLPAKVVSKVDKALKPLFAAALQRRIAEKMLPETVGVVEVRGKPQLYLRKLPPPAVELSQALVRTLETLRSQGDNAYPPPLKELIRRAGPAAGTALVKEATALPPFAGRALYAAPRDPAAPVALAEDRDALLSSPALLEYAVQAVRRPDHQAVPLTELKKKITKPLQAAFEAAVVARVAAGAPPSPVVGRLYVKKKPHFFLLCDVAAAPASGGRQPPDGATSLATGSTYQGADASRSPTPVDFAALFDQAFDRLDRQKGSHNLVSLLDLRPAVAAERAAFDAGLHQLRRAGRYTLSTAEGRHGVSPEERAAGLVEDGALLLFISKKIATPTM